MRIEEIESTAVASSKRTIQKMEIRITELETMIDRQIQLYTIRYIIFQYGSRPGSNPVDINRFRGHTKITFMAFFL